MGNPLSDVAWKGQNSDFREGGGVRPGSRKIRAGASRKEGKGLGGQALKEGKIGPWGHLGRGGIFTRDTWRGRSRGRFSVVGRGLEGGKRLTQPHPQPTAPLLKSHS